MTKYLFEVYNVAGITGGAKFSITCEEGKDPYYDVLLPLLHANNVECWHIDYTYSEYGQYRGSLEEIFEQRMDEELAEDVSNWIVPGARYNNGWDEEESEEEPEEPTYKLFFDGDLAYEGVNLEFCEEAHKKFEGNVCVVTWERINPS